MDGVIMAPKDKQHNTPKALYLSDDELTVLFNAVKNEYASCDIFTDIKNIDEYKNNLQNILNKLS